MGFKTNLSQISLNLDEEKSSNDYFFSIPKTIICIDSFRVLKKITVCLNSVRKRILRRYRDSQEYKLLKYRYELLLKSGDKINDEKYFFDRTLGYTTSEAGVLECNFFYKTKN